MRDVRLDLGLGRLPRQQLSLLTACGHGTTALNPEPDMAVRPSLMYLATNLPRFSVRVGARSAQFTGQSSSARNKGVV